MHRWWIFKGNIVFSLKKWKFLNIDNFRWFTKQLQNLFIEICFFLSDGFIFLKYIIGFGDGSLCGSLTLNFTFRF